MQSDTSSSPFRPSTPAGNGKGKGRAVDSDLLALDIGSAEEGKTNGHVDGFQQMQLVEQQVRSILTRLLSQLTLEQDTYISSRATAIESIESTIAELGQIFTQLATMVAEQRETVQRIDADTIDIANNVSGAQRELLKYYASISSNRWLMLKVFGVLIVFVSFRSCYLGTESNVHRSSSSSSWCHRSCTLSALNGQFSVPRQSLHSFVYPVTREALFYSLFIPFHVHAIHNLFSAGSTVRVAPHHVISSRL